MIIFITIEWSITLLATRVDSKYK